MDIEDSSKNLTTPIRGAKIVADMTVDELVREYSGCAFGAGRLAEAVDIYYKMLASEKTTKFFGLAGAMIPAGMRNIIADLIRDGYIDVLVTTGANMVHDTVEALGLHHYKGTACANDIQLRHDCIDRIYDVYLPDQHFTELEEFLQSIYAGLPKEKLSIRQVLTEIGKNLDDDSSILKTAADMGVPVYCPAIQDSVIGLQAWLYKEGNPLHVDAFADMHEFMDICYETECAGAMLLGGGVPKNYILQSMLVTPRSFDYAIQLTMDRPETGGLSGATLDEAQSWGKVGENAKTVTVYADATITLPLIVAAVRTRLLKR
ncbi:deoxyhypusine synthase [Methanosarcina thermophila]|jgi:deoxyhypusine synthase|uniref:Probable deoxyhypusine synthase n=2 Tax=Methanosarcina thermophila TaxID=2210 RepID=A0A1I7AUR7_METTE|nr:deoxyhypusine synthase [Methanosarcina thermophila]ALK04445.1 MAG: deoxyhypusine synthase [Methanosarcina sp. 795]AKB13084.1 Deoxyhypusine synthase [Methanosarcina thermophila TM-1]SFT78680.1 deoxyhypusine synthase [Methanosarcina thermophila]BAW28073.1 deoxyhypusine synthase [Methanosarcina thermophila]HOA69938.1 deoxyhypusine synthase [Methanosarcina thermophila]